MLETPDVAAVLAAAPVAHVAVGARQGPHVTPQVMVLAAGRLWLATTHDALKAKVLRRRPGVGVLAVAPDGRAVVVRGEAAVLDAGDPVGLVRNVWDTVRTGPAVATYALRNGEELLGTLRNALSLQLGSSVLQRRVLVAIRPTDVNEAAAPVGRGTAVLGWLTERGPVALPAQWDPERAVATVATRLWDAVGAAGAGPACVTVEDDDGAGAGSKNGVMLRGHGVSAAVDGQVEIVVDAARATWWQGVESDTVTLA